MDKPKWWRHKNEICEIMGFVKIFWKNNVQDAYQIPNTKRDVDPNEENKCVMVLLIWNKKNQEPIKFDGLLKESWNLYLNEIYFKYLPLYANFT